MPYCSVMMISFANLTCLSILPTQVYICKVCQNAFCVECDLFVHDSLHCCPGCIHEHPAPVSVWSFWKFLYLCHSCMNLISLFSHHSNWCTSEQDDYRGMNSGVGANVNFFMFLLLLIYIWIICIYFLFLLKNYGFFQRLL